MKKSLLVLVLLAGCAGGKPPTLKAALSATIATVDTAYGLAVQECDAKEKAVVARPVSTIEKDKADIVAIRQLCDQIFMAFEQARNAVPLVRQLETIK